MKKENLLYIIVVLLVFISGFLLGDKMNDSGRYQTKDFAFTTDTKKGIIYVLREDDYITFNLKNGEKKTINFKKIEDQK